MKSIKKLTTISIAALSLFAVGATGFANNGVVANNNVLAAPSDDQTKSLEEKINTLNQEAAKLNTKVSDKQLEIDKINAQIDKSQDEIAATKTDISKAEAELDARKDVLKAQLVDLQKQSNNTISGNVYLDYLLNSGDFGDLIGRTMAVNKISSANKAAINDVNDAKAKLNKLVESQEAKQAEVVASKEKLQTEMKSIEADKAKAEASQNELQQELWDHQEELEAAEKANTEASNALVEQAQAAAADTAATPAATTTTDNGSASTSNGSSSSSSNSSSNTGSTGGNINGGGLISAVAQYIGVPYVYGGSSPAGFDCSGLIWYASGKTLPRTSQAQSTLGTYVAVSDLQAGDLVFWGGVGSAYHVGIYIGGGQYIHAPAPGQNVSVGSVQYFAPSFGKRL